MLRARGDRGTGWPHASVASENGSDVLRPAREKGTAGLLEARKSLLVPAHDSRRRLQNGRLGFLCAHSVRMLDGGDVSPAAPASHPTPTAPSVGTFEAITRRERLSQRGLDLSFGLAAGLIGRATNRDAHRPKSLAPDREAKLHAIQTRGTRIIQASGQVAFPTLPERAESGVKATRKRE